MIVVIFLPSEIKPYVFQKAKKPLFYTNLLLKWKKYLSTPCFWVFESDFFDFYLIFIVQISGLSIDIFLRSFTGINFNVLVNDE